MVVTPTLPSAQPPCAPQVADAPPSAPVPVDRVMAQAPAANDDAPGVLQSSEEVTGRLRTLEAGAQALSKVQTLTESLAATLTSAAKNLKVAKAQALSCGPQWQELDQTGKRVLEDLSFELQRAESVGQSTFGLSAPWLKMDLFTGKFYPENGRSLAALANAGFREDGAAQFASVWAGYRAFTTSATTSGFAIESATLSNWWGRYSLGGHPYWPSVLNVSFRRI